jgi:hypothetical protein
MPDVPAQISASVDRMVIMYFMRDLTEQIHQDVTFLNSLSAEEKVAFEQVGQNTRRHALIGAVTAPCLFWACKRAFIAVAGHRLPSVGKAGAVTLKALHISAYVLASASGGFYYANKAMPANIERLVALPPPSTIGARARASVMLLSNQVQRNDEMPQDTRLDMQEAIRRYRQLFPLGQTGEEHELKNTVDALMQANALRNKVLKRSPPVAGADPQDDDIVFIGSGSSSRLPSKPLDSKPLPDQSTPRPLDPDAPPPTDRPRRRSSYDRPRALPEDAKPAEAVKPAARVVYNRWGDVVSPEDRKDE